METSDIIFWTVFFAFPAYCLFTALWDAFSNRQYFSERWPIRAWRYFSNSGGLGFLSFWIGLGVIVIGLPAWLDWGEHFPRLWIVSLGICVLIFKLFQIHHKKKQSLSRAPASVLQNATAPQGDEILKAQIDATHNPNVPTVFTLVPAGVQVPEDHGLIEVQTAAGMALVNPLKADPDEIKRQLDRLESLKL